MNKRYFSLIKNEETKEVDVNIFGDITSWAWEELGEFSMQTLSKQLEELSDVKTINVHINSYGGEVAEGLAIYNSLKNHKAKVKTFCDGFACSIASVIFMAGDERVMSKASLLMIHNAWTYAMGNANELRKQAEDLDKITQASINAYMEHLSISEEELKTLLDNETWLTYEECLEMGFATSVTSDSNTDKASQSVRNKLVKMILENQEEENKEPEDEEETDSNVEVDDEETETDGEEETESTEEEVVDEETEENKEEKDVTNEKMVAFFNAISK